MWNFKTLQMPKNNLNWWKILELQICLSHIMGYNVHDLFILNSFIILKKLIFFLINFWLWFEIVIIFKDETLNLQGIDTFSNFHIYSKI
jgi:hypothetical protein